LWGGITAGVAFGVAEGVGAMSGADAHGANFFNGVNKASVTKAIAHGLSRATIQKLRYGTGKGAFLSGFVSSGFSVGGNQGTAGAFQMAIVAGTVSAIGGGKFANVAWGSAFQYLFNDLMDQYANKMAFNRDGDSVYPFFEENMTRFANALKEGFIRGLNQVSMISGVASAASLYVGNIPAANVFGSISLATETSLYYLGAQSGHTTYRNYYIDATTSILDKRYPGTGTALGITVKSVSNY
jgi:hypothetical protein